MSKFKPYGYVLPSGLYLVVYSCHFEWLQCDHGDGTRAVDLFNDKGEYVDGIVACPRCIPPAESFITSQEEIAYS